MVVIGHYQPFKFETNSYKFLPIIFFLDGPYQSLDRGFLQIAIKEMVYYIKKN